MKLQSKNVVVCAVVAVVLALGVVGFSQRYQSDQDRLRSGQALQEARARQAAQIRNNTDQDADTSTCFRIVGSANPVGAASSFLLNQCTGETWWYDSGWDYDEGEYGAYVREKTWRRVNKQ